MYIYATRIFTIIIPLITAAVLGASGYSGAELLRLLNSREDVEIAHCVAASSAGKSVAELYPMFAGMIDRVYEPYDPNNLSGIDVAFLALPSGEAMRIVPEIYGKVGRIIDLGGDFRLSSPNLYQEFYHREHTSSHLLADAVYGLPELNFDAIQSATLVANPGCYPTSAILALLPALRNKLVSPSNIIINSMSGVSGAGRSASLEMSFSEVNENIRAYKIGKHQHIPEIQSVLERAAGEHVSMSFVPHLVPITRGIYTTVHADLLDNVREEDIAGAYGEFYLDAPFVRIKKEIPQLSNVIRTNFCDIHFTIEPRTNQLIVVSVIDNLVKGAAGQAIQNMNIMFQISQERGLQKEFAQ